MLSTASSFCFGQFVFKVIFSFTVSVFFILLQSYLSNGNKKAPAYHVFLACKFFMGMGFLVYVQLT